MTKRDHNAPLRASVADTGVLPLAWAGTTTKMDYQNLGDALSPIMAALMSGLEVQRVPTASPKIRMACVGTIAHGFSGGECWFWGTGSSPWRNPSAPAPERRAFVGAEEPGFHATATRGLLSEELISGDVGKIGVYGDPVWLLPRFYNPKPRKTWKLGVIVHLSELADRATTPNLKPELLRYLIPEDFRDEVRIIHTVTEIGVAPMKARIDEILACERIVSTSLHGMVFAESYGIPCLHFPTSGAKGPGARVLTDLNLDLRFVDLYSGLGLEKLPIYAQPQRERTDWAALMKAVDDLWEEKPFDAEALIEAFPLDLNLLEAPAGQTIWDHPVLNRLVLQHDVAKLRQM